MHAVVEEPNAQSQRWRRPQAPDIAKGTRPPPFAALPCWHSVSLLFALDKDQVLIVEPRVKSAKGRTREHDALTLLLPVICPARTLFRDNGLDHAVPGSHADYIALADGVARAVCRLTLHANDGTERCGRPQRCALLTSAARPHSLQWSCWPAVSWSMRDKLLEETIYLPLLSDQRLVLRHLLWQQAVRRCVYGSWKLLSVPGNLRQRLVKLLQLVAPE
jgi:hypothetical protein